MENNHVFNEMTGLYPVNKTLTFDLKPVGKTKEILELNPDSILNSDINRDEYSRQVKEILSDYYTFVAQESLKTMHEYIHESDIITLYNCYLNTINKEHDKKQRAAAAKAYDNEKKALCKRLTAWSEDVRKAAGFEASKMAGLFDEQKSPLLLWLADECGNGRISHEEYDSKKEIICGLKGYVGYVADYIDKKNLMFKAEDKQNCMVGRMLVNLQKSFDNRIALDKLYVTSPAILTYAGSDELTCISVPHITQPEIDTYNDIIATLNMQINLIRQQTKLSKAELPLLTKLYNQINTGTKAIQINTIDSEEELVSVVKDTYTATVNLADRMKTLFENTDSGDGIFVKSYQISKLCHDTYGNHDVAKACLEEEMESSPKSIPAITIGEKYTNLATVQQLIDKWHDSFEDFTSSQFAVSDALRKHMYHSLSVTCAELLSIAEAMEQLKNKDASIIKEFMDIATDICKTVSVFYTDDTELTEKGIDFNAEFMSEIQRLYADSREINTNYNLVRNYMTKKPYRKDKIRCYFDKATLLSGWSASVEGNSLSNLLKKDGKYYLMIHNRDFASKQLFSNEDILNTAIAQPGDEYFEKMQYYQNGDASKDLPRIIMSKKNEDLFHVTDEIREIKEKGLYKKEVNDTDAMHKWIDFCKYAISVYPNYQIFDCKFKDTKEYSGAYEFYADVNRQMFVMNFVKIKADYINTLVADGKAYLFEITNKDFNAASHGKDKLFTTYLKALFGDINLNRIADKNASVIKLQGGATVFLRKASMPRTVTHKANVPIENKNPLAARRTRTLPYDLCKDKRYTEHKLSINIPVQFNFNAQNVTNKEINEKVNDMISSGKLKNVITITRGYTHMFYYTVTTTDGDMLEQGSLNVIESAYNGGVIKTDYKALITERERIRKQENKNWADHSDIKNLKEGYISHVVHKIVSLVFKYNAIIVIEKVGKDFKRSLDMDKSVFDKFEMALIKKLGFLTFKDVEETEVGGVLNALQLCGTYVTESEVFKQAGIVFLQNPAYTQNMDTDTGFINKLDTRYKNKEKSKKFFDSFERITYNRAKDVFEFEFSYENFGVSLPRDKWTLTTHGTRDWYFSSIKEHQTVDLTVSLKTLFGKNGVTFEDGENLVDAIVKCNSAKFYKELHLFLYILLKLTYFNKESGDYFVSPVADNNGHFLDTRTDMMFHNAASISTYNLFMKYMLEADGTDWLTAMQAVQSETRDFGAVA